MVGTPIPAVVLPSDAPPVAASASRKPSRSASATAWSTDSARALELLHRPPAGHLLEIDGHLRQRRAGGDRPDGNLGGLHPLASRRPNVGFEDAPLGDDVRPSPAFDHADVDGHAGPAAVEGVQLVDEASGLEDGAAAFLGLDPGVRRPAVDDEAQVENALARRHDVAVVAGALEDEADVGLGRDLADVGSRAGRADLLVGVVMKTSRSKGSPSSPAAASPRRAEIA